MDAEQLFHDLELANENMELLGKQLETLRAENEALKAENRKKYDEGYWDGVKDEKTRVQKYEAKDAQIKVLVEALDSINQLMLTGNNNQVITAIELITKKALSNIPAKALEEWKLERKFMDASLRQYHYDKTCFEEHPSMTGKDYVDHVNNSDTYDQYEIDVTNTAEALEAHREKVKNND